jgi:hypothetical protein
LSGLFTHHFRPVGIPRKKGGSPDYNSDNALFIPIQDRTHFFKNLTIIGKTSLKLSPETFYLKLHILYSAQQSTASLLPITTGHRIIFFWKHFCAAAQDRNRRGKMVDNARVSTQ